MEYSNDLEAFETGTEGLTLPFALPPDHPTLTREAIDALQDTEAFNAHLKIYSEHIGLQNIRIPQLGHKEVDLYILYKEVIVRGGVDNVSQGRHWKEVADCFGFPKTCTNAGYTLRMHYKRILTPYETKFYWGVDEPYNAEVELPLPSPSSKKSRGHSPQPGSLHIKESPNPVISIMHHQPSPTFSTSTKNFGHQTNYKKSLVPRNSKRVSHSLGESWQQLNIINQKLNSGDDFEWVTNILNYMIYHKEFILTEPISVEVLNHLIQYLKIAFQKSDMDFNQIQKIISLFRGMTFTSPNEKLMFDNLDCMDLILEIFEVSHNFPCEYSGVESDIIETLCNMNDEFVFEPSIDDKTGEFILLQVMKRLRPKPQQQQQHSSAKQAKTEYQWRTEHYVMEIIRRMSEKSENENIFEMYITVLCKEMGEVLQNKEPSIIEGIISILWNIVKLDNVKIKKEITNNKTLMSELLLIILERVKSRGRKRKREEEEEEYEFGSSADVNVEKRAALVLVNAIGKQVDKLVDYMLPLAEIVDIGFRDGFQDDGTVKLISAITRDLVSNSDTTTHSLK